MSDPLINPLKNLTKEEILYQLLRKQYGYYFSILELTRQETEMLTHHHPLDEINSLLKQKKVLLSCISEIEVALRPLKKYWREKTIRSDPASQQIKQVVADLDNLLKEILQLDLISQKNLALHLEYLHNENQKRQLASKSKL